LELTAAALMVKVAVLAAAGTRTEAGVVRAPGMLLESVTVAPPVGAAFEVVTLHVVEVAEASDTLVHDKDVRVSGALIEIASVLVPPFRLAVRFAVWSVLMAAAVAVNVALV
jgi:hypothetical protein